VQDLVDSINAIVVNEDPAPGYPSRCERVRGVIVSYDKEASSLNDLRLGTNKPLYDVGECMPIAQGGGLYAARALEAGTSLHAGDVLSYGSPPADAYLPLSFQRDVDGMCALTRLRKGDRLTWDNLGVCALMSGH
jgi:hypothetical protein